MSNLRQHNGMIRWCDRRLKALTEMHRKMFKAKKQSMTKYRYQIH